MDKPKPNKPKSQPSAKSAPADPSPTPPAKVPPLFRLIDWFVLLFCFATIWAVYLYTLAPDLTLEDSGELCTASFYAGIPHPPGYPFWSIYSYLWTLLPFGSVTWRVEVGESFAAAMACGLVGLMVSRGSSMLIEGIEELKAMERKWENAICIGCGITAGLLLGFDDFMWKESIVVNRISLFDVPWLMLVAACLMRWIYAPHQRRYLYAAMFFFGLCATIHQTMLVAAMGIEVTVAMANPRLGRDMFLWNSIIYVGACLGMYILNLPQLAPLAGLDPMFLAIFHGVGLLSIAATIWLANETKGIFLESKSVIMAFICWFLGAAFYFYEPISGMTDPPMQWGYPRTVEGFFHALSRGQYEKAHPTNVFSESGHFLQQLGLLINGLANSYSWVFLIVALLPLLFLLKMQRRERSWIVGLSAIYLCVGILLTVVMNTTPDRQSAEENKVFFTASHAIVAVMIGYGLAIMCAYMATHYKNFRTLGLALGAVSIIPAFTVLYDNICMTFFGGAGLLPYIKILLLFLCLAGTLVLTALAVQWYLKTKNDPALPEEDRIYFPIFTAAAVVFGGFAVYLAFFAREQTSIGDAIAALPRTFQPHQFSSPVIGSMFLVLATVAFIGSLIVYRKRAPLAITLALFMLTPTYSALTHWTKEQRNHWFGFWFGHDMFTPPFTGPDGKLSYDPKVREEMLKAPNGNMVYPEMTRNTILFGGTDPGRFCPTYMIFCESFVPASCKPMDPNFDRRDVYLITQNALADGTYLDYLRAQYFRSHQQDPPFFSNFLELYWKPMLGGVFLLCLLWVGVDFIQLNPRRLLNLTIIGSLWAVLAIVIFTSNKVGAKAPSNIKGSVPRAAYKLLDKPFTAFGKNVENRRRAEGVYPPSEIYIPSPDDLNQCFEQYQIDFQRRYQLNQLQPGEVANIDAQGRMQVGGQTSVMMINGLLCKVIFDQNPTNDFFIEESFPLEWMYPHETPYGIIMKINRKPLQAIPQEILDRDHQFWAKYCERFIGTNVVTDTTSVGEICTNFVEKVFLRHDFTNFQGDRKFMRDDDAQKAFSKLRDSQAGMYAWRLRLLVPNIPLTDPNLAQYRPKSDAEIQSLYKEADYAFKQSFAFCPYSPETVIRYVNFLFQFNRFDDALMIVETCKKLDPYNKQMQDLIDQIKDIQRQIGNRQAQGGLPNIEQMEAELKAHPDNLQNLLTLGTAYYQMQETDKAVAMFDRALTNPSISYGEAASLANFYSHLGMSYLDNLEVGLTRLTTLDPNRPEAHYDLAAIKAYRGKTPEALAELRISLDLSAKRRKTDPTAPDLLATNRTDSRFDSIRNLPEYKKIVPAS